MAQPTIQASFNSGEWAPALNARVDMAKYQSAAALLENFFVDYRGGASTRAGTRYILQTYKSATAVRLIPFQASFEVAYALEFGDEYIRFFADGAPVLEAAVTGGTGASGDDFTIANTFAPGDWVYALNWGGMTNVNGRYFIVSAAAAGSVTVTDLRGNAVVFTGVYTAGGQLQRVYTIVSPYAAADLALVKFAQNVNEMYLCHPSYPPQKLTYISAASWTIQDMVFGSTINTPTNVLVSTTLSAGSVNYAYIVTAVDVNGQESNPSAPVLLSSQQDIRSVAGTNTITWDSVSGAVSYNVYKADPSYTAPVQPGVPYGFIGNASGLALNDSNIAADMSQTQPVPRVPFGTGAAVAFTTLTSEGAFNGPGTMTASFAAAPSGGITATASVVYSAVSGAPNAGFPGNNYAVGDTLTFPSVAAVVGLTATVATITGPGPTGPIATITITDRGEQVGGTIPSTSSTTNSSGIGTGCIMDFVWGIYSLQLTNAGAGYLVTPAVTISAPPSGSTPTFTATLGPQNTSYPSVPTLFQQRLVLAAPTNATQSMYFSQPGSIFNFDVSQITQPEDSIVATLVSGQLNNIKSMISQPAGLLVLTDRASWLINGGGTGTGIAPDAIVANAQSFNGANDVPPIVSNYDVLYVQSKGSIVRDSSYNFYANVFTGTDISVLSSHLFYGYTILEWAWAEEPFKIVWAVRDDGALLALTFLKEQEFIGWTHSITDGLFKSVTAITEETADQTVDAVYFVVERTIDGDTVRYIERMAERIFPNGVIDAWCVDSGLQYNGVPATSFSGGEHLAGETVTGLADGVVIEPFVMPASGNFTLASASKVTIGLPYTCKLQTLAIDLGAPTVQGKVKKIPSVTVRVADTLGLKIGQDFNHLVAMKDLVRGNVSSTLTGQQSQLITDLVTGDAQTIIDPAYTVPGQYCIQLDLPYPASVLGVIPEITVGDTK